MLSSLKGLDIPSKYKYGISFFIAVVLGLNIYYRSEMPPYGHPNVELNKQYWGIIVDIAHRWRDFDFTLWNREIAGGMSLFTSLLYPVLNPTNALAWFLNDYQFFLAKLIEPYVVGFFFMMILLWDVFKTRWYIAIFGGLAYMALMFGKQTIIVSNPFFLPGCAIFPGMVFALIKFAPRHVYLAAAAVGALLAVQFLSEGTAQFLQMIIFWEIFFTIYFIWQGWSGKQNTSARKRLLKRWFLTICIFLTATISFGAVQFIPSIYYFFSEVSPSRQPGYYSVNNFPLFYDASVRDGMYYLSGFIWGGLMGVVPIREKLILIIALVALALSVIHFGRIFARTEHKRFFYMIWTAAIVFFVLPSVAGLLVTAMPFLKSVFGFLTLVTFRYAIYVMDFCLVLTLCLIMNNDELSFVTQSAQREKWVRRGVACILLILALAAAVLPLAIVLMPQGPFPFKEFFLAGSFKKAVFFTIQALIVIACLVFRPRHILKHVLLIFILFNVGFMMMLTCFKWYNKGSRSEVGQYQLTSPEHDYYRKAKGKYILPFLHPEPIWVMANFNMLYGVYGTYGMTLPPLRLISFQCYYNKDCSEANPNLDNGLTTFLTINKPAPASLTTYFPVDFTFVPKDTALPWPDFAKVVSGERYDVYERKSATPGVYFANEIKVASLSKVIEQFDIPRSNTIYVTNKDAQYFNIGDTRLAGNLAGARYSNIVKRGNRVSFEVNADQEMFIVVPEMYSKGWKASMDGGRQLLIFPADYLFIGLSLPAGHHFVELSYTPPWLWHGLVINMLGIGGLVWLFRRYYFRKLQI